MYPRVYRAASTTPDKSYIGFIGSLQHFTRLQSLAINVTFYYSEVFEPWESLGALISTGSMNSGIKILSIRFAWYPPRYGIDSRSLPSGLELVLRKAEVLDALLDNSFEHLTTLSLDMHYSWPSDLRDGGDHLRTHLSQSAIEGALRKKLPKISQKVCLNVSVYHHVP